MNFFQRLLGFFLVLTVLSASTPLSLLHEHEHIEVCQVNLNLAEKSKTDKDQYPVHLHTGVDDCFLCFENHQFTGTSTLVALEIKIVIAANHFQQLDIFKTTCTPHFVLGRAPPFLLS